MTCFLRGLPFKEPSRVVHFYGGDKSRGLEDIGIGAPRFDHFRDGQTICESLAARTFSRSLLRPGRCGPDLGGRSLRIILMFSAYAQFSDAIFFPRNKRAPTLRSSPGIFGKNEWAANPNVIGRSITLDGTAHTIVGVLPNMPATWFGANQSAEVWTTKPIQLPGFSYERLMRGTSFLR